MLDREELIEHVEWLLNEGESERAWMLCKRGLRRYPRDAELWLFMADSLFDSNRLSEADKAYRRAGELQPDWAIAYAKRAEVQLMLGHVEKAQELAELSHAQNRDLAHASFVQAVCVELAGDDEVAHFWYRRAQHLQPDQYYAPLNVTRERFQEDFQAALDHLINVGDYKTALSATRWFVMDRVDRRNPELRTLSPMTFCYLVPEEERSDEADDMRIQRGYIFRRNILRDCRTPDDLYTQLYVSLLEELEAVSGDDDVDSF